MFGMQVTIRWSGDRISQQLMTSLRINLRTIGIALSSAIKKKISVWGSTPLGGIWRFRDQHSDPGQPPLQQTGELHNSIIDLYRHTNVQLTAEVSSDVAYADELELGGTSQVNQFNKVHTSFRLVNPLTHPFTIAPRPAWLPVFKSLLNWMILQLKQSKTISGGEGLVIKTIRI